MTDRDRAVLHCIATLEGGGAERHLSYLAEGLADRGWRVEVALLRLGPNAERVRAAGVPIRVLGHRGSYDPRAVTRLRSLIRQTDPTIVHTWLPLMTVAGGLAAISAGKRWVVSEQGSGLLDSGGPKHWVRIKLAGSRADAVVANSRAGQEFWERRVRRSMKTFLVPNGLPLDELASCPPVSRETIGVSAERQVILYAGRFEPLKDVRTLVRALPIVLSVHPEALCVLCGDGSERGGLVEEVRRGGLEGRVIFAGYVEPLASWLKNADVFVSPSLSEGQPNAVLEAMACGVPLVVSDIPAHREFLDEGCARFAPVGSAESFAAAIADSLTDRDSARSRAARARDRARGFTLESMVSSYEAVYEDVLQGLSSQRSLV